MIEDELEPLITCCPNCSTRFRVTESQLAVAAGRVRCGACLTVFEGTAHLVLDDEDRFATEQEADAALDELLNELGGFSPEEGGFRTGRGMERAGGTPTSADDLAPAAFYGGHEESEEEFSFPGSYVGEVGEAGEPAERLSEDLAEEAADEGEGPLDAETTEQSDATMPAVEAAGGMGAGGVPEGYETGWGDAAVAESVEGADRARSPGAPVESPAQIREDELLSVTAPVDFSPEPRRWWVGAVAGVFILALIGQVLFFQFPVWSRDAELRPVYELICGAVGCELPQMRDLSALRTSNLVVRSHPELDRALVVDAVIVNEAEFEQPFPDLELRFTAVDGMLVAGRRFAPDEYLIGDEARPDAMPSRTPVQVSLEIEDPGPAAVNYMLRFR